MSKIQLKEADKLEVVVLVENYTDLFLMEDQGVMRRPPMPTDFPPLAEHGLSLLLKVYAHGIEHHMLMDAGITPGTLLNNMSLYDIDVEKIEGVILSHGHLDHFGGLMGYLEKAPKGRKLILHPDTFFPRRLNVPGVGPLPVMRTLNEDQLEAAGVEIHKVSNAAAWCSDLILTLGEVERLTDFETGFPWAEIRKDDSWSTDPFKDDQGVAINIRDQGLVVIGGCSHAGIVNTVQHARKVSGVQKVHAVLGGFHLTGPLFEPLIERTVEKIKEIGPDYVMPMHCTGWKAINAFKESMPEKFFLTSVGTRYVFQSNREAC